MSFPVLWLLGFVSNTRSQLLSSTGKNWFESSSYSELLRKLSVRLTSSSPGSINRCKTRANDDVFISSKILLCFRSESLSHFTSKCWLSLLRIAEIENLFSSSRLRFLSGQQKVEKSKAARRASFSRNLRKRVHWTDLWQALSTNDCVNIIGGGRDRWMRGCEWYLF